MRSYRPQTQMLERWATAGLERARDFYPPLVWSKSHSPLNSNYCIDLAITTRWISFVPS